MSTTTIENTQPTYIISDRTLNKETFQAASIARNYYSWLEVFSKAYIDIDGKEKVNILRVKAKGIDPNGHFVLTLPFRGYATTHSAAAAREVWAQQIRDFGWKVVDDPNIHRSLDDVELTGLLYHNINEDPIYDCQM